MTNVLDKAQRKAFFKALQIQIKITFFKYYQYLKVVKGDYRWLLMFAVARFPLGRAMGSSFYSNRIWLRRKTNQMSAEDSDLTKTIFKDLNVDLVVQSTEQNGYFLGLELPHNTVRHLLEFAYSADISADGNPRWKFKYAEREQAVSKYGMNILVGNYVESDLKECMALNQLKQDPKLRAIAAKYLKSNPVLVRSQMSWTFVGDRKAFYEKGDIGSPTVLFHYDLDDYRAIKFFFYLTDVDSLSGSHRCVAGSHRRRKLVHYILRGQSDRKIEQYYGAENIIDICGPVGFGFAEDPFCFHRGSPPVTSPRLMIQLEFALNDYQMWN